MVLLLVVTIFYVPLALPLIIGLLIRWRYVEHAAAWQPHLARFSIYSLLLMAVAGLPAALPKIAGALGTWLIAGAVLLALGGTLVGYLLGFGNKPRRRKVLAVGAGQRNLAAALLVAAHGFDADTFVMTLVACLVLTVVMHLVSAEWGRRTADVAA